MKAFSGIRRFAVSGPPVTFFEPSVRDLSVKRLDLPFGTSGSSKEHGIEFSTCQLIDMVIDVTMSCGSPSKDILHAPQRHDPVVCVMSASKLLFEVGQ